VNTYTVTLVCVDARGNTINKAEFVTQANFPLIMSAYEGLIGKRIRDYSSGEMFQCVGVECTPNQTGNYNAVSYTHLTLPTIYSV